MEKGEDEMKKKQFVYLAAIVVIVLSIVLMLVNLNRTESLVSSPFWWFFMGMTLGFGILSFVLGCIRKSPVCFFLAALLLDGFLVYLTIDVFSLIWYVVLIVGIMFLVVLALLDLFLLGNRTEAIAENDATKEVKKSDRAIADSEQGDKKN